MNFSSGTISVVIITKNESLNITDCIQSARRISSDIIVVDTGSIDATVLQAKHAGARVYHATWISYAHARNLGASHANKEWIFALDADERISNELATKILSVDHSDERTVYGFKRTNFLYSQKIIFGPLAHDRVFRLYNKNTTHWDDRPVHEKLTGLGIKFHTLSYPLLHYGNKNPQHYAEKKMMYAKLWADNKYAKRQKATTLKQVASTLSSFVKAYILQGGSLDIRYGFLIAMINARYTWYKYALLKKLHAQNSLKEEFNTKEVYPGYSKAV